MTESQRVNVYDSSACVLILPERRRVRCHILGRRVGHEMLYLSSVETIAQVSISLCQHLIDDMSLFVTSNSQRRN